MTNESQEVMPDQPLTPEQRAFVTRGPDGRPWVYVRGERNYVYEDELPGDISDELYARWFAQSWVDGVRLGPRLEDLQEQRPAELYGDGHTCTHHPDDPAHGPQCYPNAHCEASRAAQSQPPDILPELSENEWKRIGKVYFAANDLPNAMVAMRAEFETILSRRVAAERERCADIADSHASVEGIAQRIASAIRATGARE